jgi:predicted aldo/keto reductase-like oxidoreductase
LHVAKDELMDIRSLGSTGLEPPVVGMGTWNTFDVHEATEEAHAKAVVDTALENGAAFFDSSPMMVKLSGCSGPRSTGAAGTR